MRVFGRTVPLSVFALYLTIGILACAPLTTGERLSSVSTLVEVTPALQSSEWVVDGESHAQYIEPLEMWAEARGVIVEFHPDLRAETRLFGIQGYSPSGVAIVIVDTSTPRNNQFLTLLHELTHVLHGRVLSKNRPVAEVIAESTAYEAARRLGLNTQAQSMSYLMQFPGGERDEVYRLFGDQIERWSKLLAEAAEGKWRQNGSQ